MKYNILYGTEVGTTKYVSEVIAKQLNEAGYTVSLFEAGISRGLPELQDGDVVLLGSPTYYGGQPESKIQKLLTEFHPDLSKHPVAVFSLGDSGYSHFCGSAETLEAWVAEHKGSLLVPTLKIDGYPYTIEPITTWVKEVIKKLK